MPAAAAIACTSAPPRPLLVAVLLAVVQLVVLKMLPFDNKSEFQVVVNMPEGTPVEGTARVLAGLAGIVRQVPEVTNYQAYAGTAAPINFNGLVRQYYLRGDSNQGDLQVNLVDKSDRSRKSHDIARAIRPALAAEGKRLGAASVQVVEVPPGPPVQAPLVAEIYGPIYAAQQKIGHALRAMFDSTRDIVDTDDTLSGTRARATSSRSIEPRPPCSVFPRRRPWNRSPPRSAGRTPPMSIRGRERDPIAVRLELASADKRGLQQALALPVRATSGALVPLSEVVTVSEAPWDATIYHKDLLPVVFVTGDMAGRLDSPLYGMFSLVSQINKTPPGGPGRSCSAS